jgi:hypothetical protein
MELTSPFLEGVAREAEGRRGRQMLTATIVARLGTAIPKDITKRISSEQDFDRMLRWTLAIPDLSSFDELRALLDA